MPLRSSRLSVAVAASVVAFFACAVPSAFAQSPKAPTTPDLIEKAADDGKISKRQERLTLANALARPSRVPPGLRSDEPWDGTLTLLGLREELASMPDGAARDELAAALAPTGCSNSTGNLPNLDNTSPNFRIEYGTIGGGLNIAAYRTSLDTSWNTETGTFGWAKPPLDTAINKYPVRIDTLGSGLYGYVAASGTYAGLAPSGNNPNTPWNEGDAYKTCMVLNNDYGPFAGTSQQALDSTTAHEFNHSIQFGYGALSGSNAPDDSFVEGGATWMEDEVFDNADDNYNYLWPDFTEDGMGEYDASPYPYWITFRGLTERYGTGTAGGGEQVMQDFWEDISDNSATGQLNAFEAAFTPRGTTLAAAFHAYAIAVRFNKPCGGGYAYPYCFEEAAGYQAAAGARPVNATVSAAGGSATAKAEDDYGLAWVALPTAGGPYPVTITNGASAGNGKLRASAVCDTGSGLTISELPQVVTGGQSSTLSSFNPVGCTGGRFAVVTNESKTAANPTNSADRTFTIAAGSPVSPTTKLLTVSKSGTGSGTVTSNPTGINCGTDCTHEYTTGTPVELTATQAAGSTFTGWSGACTGQTATCTVTMSEARSVTASFAASPKQLTVSRSGTGTGTVTSNPAGIDCGTDCTEDYAAGTSVVLTATAGPDSTFTSWGGACSGQAATCTVTMSDARTVTASFAAGTRPLSVTRSGTGGGTVTSSPTGIDCGNDCAEGYTTGTSVVLTATAAAGSTFTSWGGACSGQTATCTVVMSEARSVTASFAATPKQLTVTPAGTGDGTVTSNPTGIDCGADCTEVYTAGTNVVLTATAAAGSTFSGWSGACAGQTATCTVTMSDARSVTASFAANPPPPEDPPVVTPTPTPTPTTPTIQPVTPILSQIDLVPPALARLALSSTSFRAARSGRGVVAIAATTGTRVAINLSEAARIGLRVQVLTKTRRWATKRGSLSLAGKAGLNRFRFTGRINGRALAPGRYRLVVTARDAAGNLSAAKRIGFRIVR